ncbi:DUF2577 domain-containing protein [Cohnella thailandensis]|uniref:DUF2577 domain-containing protein n=1 Tax=Cohnella thailandensis TaxID=557557 RepID=A0A841SLG1_9BACL|nr:DUF2577 domain-containing protein [Cohnella thailandensis]MBB6632754.1 DUF2577 domain-containing protein [Cohnella thailandensis]MBP1975557.1 hypothetical protein [Cohnella thailandensis]
MIDAIKQAALAALEASCPVIVQYGTITNPNPLEVNVDQRFTLDADFLIQTEATTELKATIAGVDYVIRPGLQAGDQVVLVRLQGGQKYLILDRVVET